MRRARSAAALSSVTFTSTPTRRSVSLRNAAARADDATPLRISSENPTARRAASSSMPSPLRSRSPSSASISRATCGLPRPSGRSGLNQAALAGVTGPAIGSHAPKNTCLQYSRRSTAIEIASRNASVVSHGLSCSLSVAAASEGLAAVALAKAGANHRASASRPGPSSNRRTLPFLLQLFQRFVVIDPESRCRRSPAPLATSEASVSASK